MRGMAKGSLALLLGIVVLVLGPRAGAQALEEYPDVTVSPGTIVTANTEVTVSGPAFPNQTGCRPGTILGIPDGGGLGDAVPLVTGDLNTPVTEDGRWELTFLASFVPLAATTYTIYLDCKEANLEQTYTTKAQFTVAATATTIPTTTTTTTQPVEPGVTQASTTTTTSPPGTQGTVDPTTAKPGETTITIRGGGFKAGATLQISLGTTPPTALGTTTANASGAYAATLKLPASAPPGNQQLLVTGPGPDDVSRSTTATLTVEDLDCNDFATPAAAQAALAGGRDPHGLDADKDGIPCEAGSTQTAARSGGGGGGGGGTAAAPSGSLPQTGTERSTIGVMAGLTAMTLGALLVGLSHPAVPASGRHRRRRTWRH